MSERCKTDTTGQMSASSHLACCPREQTPLYGTRWPLQNEEESDMEKKRDLHTTQVYSNCRSFDGKPLERGKALVPFRTDAMELRKGDYVPDHLMTIQIDGFTFEIGFMAIDEAKYAVYMKEFQEELEVELSRMHKSRCILGYEKTGEPILCSDYHRCSSRPDQGILGCKSPNRIEILSLEYEYEQKGFDIADHRQPSLEEQVLNRLEPDPVPAPKEPAQAMPAVSARKNSRCASRRKMKLPDNI